MLALELRVRVRVGVTQMVRVTDDYGTERLGTKRFGYEMSVSRAADCQCQTNYDIASDPYGHFLPLPSISYVQLSR